MRSLNIAFCEYFETKQLENRNDRMFPEIMKATVPYSSYPLLLKTKVKECAATCMQKLTYKLNYATLFTFEIDTVYSACMNLYRKTVFIGQKFESWRPLFGAVNIN